jgi:GxxExxY protein
MTDIPTLVEDAASRVVDELPDGLRENAYHQALSIELSDCDGIRVTDETTIPVYYRGTPVARVHPDMCLIDDGGTRYLVEIKAGYDGREQLRQYLELAEDSSMDVDSGIFVNFGEDLTVEGMVAGTV